MTKFGVYLDNNPANLSSFETFIGKPVNAVMVFIGAGSWTEFTSGTVDLAWRNVQREIIWSVPLIVTGATLADAVSGAYDSYWTAVAMEIADNRPNDPIIEIRTGWEFNGNWQPWTAIGNEANFIAAFQRFVTLFRGVSQRFRFEWSTATGDFGMNPETAYPGDSYVDRIGTNIFWFPGTAGTDQNTAWNVQVTQTYGLQWHRDFSNTRNKPIAFSEWGVPAGTDSRIYLQNIANWFAGKQPVYHVYWNAPAASGYDGIINDGRSTINATTFTSLFVPKDTTEPLPATEVMLFSSVTAPGGVVQPDTGIELGMRFYTAVPGQVVGVRFWKPSTANAGPHIGNLWDANGVNLATVTFSGETASGWQRADFSTPVQLTARTHYVISYYAPSGSYQWEILGFKNAITTFPLTAPAEGPVANSADALANGSRPANTNFVNGVYSYGAASSFPVLPWRASNYYVEPVFLADINTSADTGEIVVHMHNDTAGVASFETWLGRPLGGVSVFIPHESWPVFTDGVVVNQWALTNRKVYWSVPLIVKGATLANAVLGIYDTQWTTLATQLNNARPSDQYIDVRIGWKFNGEWFPWSAHAQNSASYANSSTLFANSGSANSDVQGVSYFILAFQRMVNVFRGVSSRFRIEWSTEAGDLGFNPESAYPGSEFVDIIGTSFYWNTHVQGMINSTAWNAKVSEPYGLQWHRTFAASQGKPIAFSEWGVPAEIDATEYLSLAAAWFVENLPVYHSYWNIQNTAGSFDAANSGKLISFDGKIDGMRHPENGIRLKELFSTGYEPPPPPPPPTTDEVRLFTPSNIPAEVVNDTNPIEVGVKFTSSVVGSLVGVWFYKPTASGGPHYASVWNASGLRLARVQYLNETAEGWQRMNFATPVSIAPNTQYTVSVYFPAGLYPRTTDFFIVNHTVNPLTGLRSRDVNGNGVFFVGTDGAFPINTINPANGIELCNSIEPANGVGATNFWVDPIYDPDTVAPPPPSGRTPKLLRGRGGTRLLRVSATRFLRG
jgi:beta-mannanase